MRACFRWFFLFFCFHNSICNMFCCFLTVFNQSICFVRGIMSETLWVHLSQLISKPFWLKSSYFSSSIQTFPLGMFIKVVILKFWLKLNNWLCLLIIIHFYEHKTWLLSHFHSYLFYNFHPSSVLINRVFPQRKITWDLRTSLTSLPFFVSPLSVHHLVRENWQPASGSVKQYYTRKR